MMNWLSAFLIPLLLFNFATVNEANLDEGPASSSAVEVVEMEKPQFLSGHYEVEGGEHSPTFTINLDDYSWRTTRSLATSYSISGELFLTEDGFAAHTEDGDIEIQFRVDKGMELTVLSVQNKKTELDFWIRQGQVFKPRYLDSLYPEYMGTVLKPEQALSKAKEAGFTVFEDHRLVAGAERWLDFYEASKRGEFSSVLIASYITEGPEDADGEPVNRDYPRLYFNELVYDGKYYRLRDKQSDLAETFDQSYTCLNHYVGDFPEGSEYKSYDYYVLCDQEDVSWKDIEKSMLSSHWGAAIRHEIVYMDHRK